MPKVRFTIYCIEVISCAALLNACAQHPATGTRRSTVLEAVPDYRWNDDFAVKSLPPGRMCHVDTPDCEALDPRPFQSCLLSGNRCPQTGELMLVPEPTDSHLMVLEGLE
jgi:hypothetical protein